jgi:hypothetical protein
MRVWLEQRGSNWASRKLVNETRLSRDAVTSQEERTQTSFAFRLARRRDMLVAHSTIDGPES